MGLTRLGLHTKSVRAQLFFHGLRFIVVFQLLLLISIISEAQTQSDSYLAQDSDKYSANQDKQSHIDTIDERTGSVSFELPLFQLPGPNGLDVGASLSFAKTTTYTYDFGNWSLEIPRLINSQLNGSDCAYQGADADQWLQIGYPVSQPGPILVLPGQSPKQMVPNNVAVSGIPGNWITSDRWTATCIPAVHPIPGQTKYYDYIVRSPSGVVYDFSQGTPQSFYTYQMWPCPVIYTAYPATIHPNIYASFGSQQGFMTLVSKITDPYGNSVTYNYTAENTPPYSILPGSTCSGGTEDILWNSQYVPINAYKSPYAGYLTSITTSSSTDETDNRTITFNWSNYPFAYSGGTGYSRLISSIVSAGHTWSFGYDYCSTGQPGDCVTSISSLSASAPILTSVKRPDGKAFTFSYANYSRDAKEKDLNITKTQWVPGRDYQVSQMTEPNGLVANFTYTNACSGFMPAHWYVNPNNPNYPGYICDAQWSTLSLAWKSYSGTNIPSPISYSYYYYSYGFHDYAKPSTELTNAYALGYCPDAYSYTFVVGPSKLSRHKYQRGFQVAECPGFPLVWNANQLIEESVFPRPSSITSVAALYSYTNTEVASCTNHVGTGCAGEVQTYTYKEGPQWGTALPGCPLGGGTALVNPQTCYGLYVNYPSSAYQKVVDRSTGSYVTQLSDYDSYFNSTVQTEYSYTNSKPGPSRVTNFGYGYSFGASTNAPPFSFNLIGLPTLTSVAGVDLKQTTYLSTGKPSKVVKNGIETDYTYTVNGDLEGTYEWKNGTKYLLTKNSNYVYGTAKLVTNADGSTIQRTVNPDGTLASQIDGYGYPTSFTYDPIMRLSFITPPIHDPTSILWPTDTTKIVTHGSLQKTLTYDSLGHLVKTQSQDLNVAANLIVTANTYDGDGRLMFASLPGYPTASTYGTLTYYDVLDRVTESVQTANSAATYYSYTAPDIMAVKTPNGYNQDYYHQNYGSPTENQLIQSNLQTSNSNDVITVMKRDPVGKLLTVTQNGVTRQYQYNSNQLLRQIDDPERSPVYLTYYTGSKLIYQKQVGTNTPITYKYDDMDRPLQTTFSNSSDDIIYQYDKDGRIHSTSTGVETTTLGYDANGNKTEEALAIDGHILKTNFSYNNMDQNYAIKYPSSSGFVKGSAVPQNTLTYNLDAFGRQTSMFDLASTVISSASYYPNGLFSAINYANGAQATLALNLNQWPEKLTVGATSGAISLSYGYDLQANTLTIVDNINSAYDQVFEYDGLDRLTYGAYNNGKSLVPAGAPSNLGNKITYSNSGDITSYTEFGEPTDTLTYDSKTLHLLSNTGRFKGSYSYDSYGQTTSNGQYIFGYDPNFNMTSIRNARTKALVANYYYDASDLRVKKIVSGGPTTYYVYSGGNLAFEASTATGTKEYFYLGKDLVGTRALSPKGVATYEYFHFNPLASPIGISNTAGAITNQQHYNPYGYELVPNPSFTNQIDVQFAGQVNDAETGLSYMKGRYYDMRIGRFLTIDPKDFSEKNVQSFNRYAYANNNPLKFVDLDGQAPEWVLNGLHESMKPYVPDVRVCSQLADQANAQMMSKALGLGNGNLQTRLPEGRSPADSQIEDAYGLTSRLGVIRSIRFTDEGIKQGISDEFSKTGNDLFGVIVYGHLDDAMVSHMINAIVTDQGKVLFYDVQKDIKSGSIDDILKAYGLKSSFYEFIKTGNTKTGKVPGHPNSDPAGKGQSGAAPQDNRQGPRME